MDQEFQESLLQSLQDTEGDRDQYLGGQPNLGTLLDSSADHHRPVVTRAYTRVQVPDFGFVQVLFTTTKGIFKCPEPYLRLLTVADAFLRFAVRTIMHDAVLSNLLDTWSHPQSSRLRRPRAGKLREAPDYADIIED